MRKTITIELTLLEADELQVYLGRTIGKIQDIVIQKGHATSSEQRMLNVFRSIGQQIQLTEEELNYVDVLIDGQNNNFDQAKKN